MCSSCISVKIISCGRQGAVVSNGEPELKMRRRRLYSLLQDFRLLSLFVSLEAQVGLYMTVVVISSFSLNKCTCVRSPLSPDMVCVCNRVVKCTANWNRSVQCDL